MNRFLLHLAVQCTLLGAWPALAQQTAIEHTYEKAISDLYDANAFRAFLSKLPRRGDYYIVEGDTPLTRRQVYTYLMSKTAFATGGMGAAGLLIQLGEGGDFAIWSETERRDLTYAIDARSFGNPERYQRIAQAFNQAARDWMDACPECDLRFRHRAELDWTLEPEQLEKGEVQFIVQRVPDNGYIAVGFFPNWPREVRYVDVTERYFRSSYDPVGIFRHELGHVLGYRHEHIRGVGCTLEPDAGEWVDLTGYDPRSVMHYPCKGNGTTDFKLSPLDIQAHRGVYGARAPAPAVAAREGTPDGGSQAFPEPTSSRATALTEPADAGLAEPADAGLAHPAGLPDVSGPPSPPGPSRGVRTPRRGGPPWR